MSTTQQRMPQAILTITPLDKKKGEINLNAHFHFLHIPEKESGLISVYIPAFDIYYSAPTFEEAKRRARLSVQSFFNFWIDQQGFNKFISQILKLGFRTDAYTIKRLINSETVKAKMNLPISGIIPPEFQHAESVEDMVDANY